MVSHVEDAKSALFNDITHKFTLLRVVNGQEQEGKRQETFLF